jgi:hypothetical protein
MGSTAGGGRALNSASTRSVQAGRTGFGILIVWAVLESASCAHDARGAEVKHQGPLCRKIAACYLQPSIPVQIRDQSGIRGLGTAAAFVRVVDGFMDVTKTRLPPAAPKARPAAAMFW